jgi:DNA recombination protein RmuC
MFESLSPDQLQTLIMVGALAAALCGFVVYRWQRRRYEALAQQMALQTAELDNLREQYDQSSELAIVLQQHLDTARLGVHEHQVEATRWQERATSQQQQLQRLEQQYRHLEHQHHQLEQQGRERQQQLLEQARLQHDRLLQQGREQIEKLQLQNRELLNQFQKQVQEQQNQLQHQLRQSQSALASEQQARQLEQQHSEEKLALLAANREQLLKEFELLSQKIYEQKQQQFGEQSRQGLNDLLNPFREQLDGLRKKVEDVYVNDSKDRAALQSQISELHKLNQLITSEAHALTNALRGDRKTQGNWGEMVLETVLERSGLRKGEEYVREQSHHDDDGQRFRPDVIINLPEGKHIVVDSKVSLNAYTDYINATDETEQAAALKRHVESVRNHIRSLSGKSYQQLEGLDSPDFVFMFMPIEPAFMLAFQQDENLFNQAFEQKIVVVTPTTLLATLRTVASLWAMERRNQNTEKLADQARKIYDKLVVVVEKFEKVGSQLETVNKSWDDAWKSLKTGRGNLISQADGFVTLGIRVKKELGRQMVEEARAEDELQQALATNEQD